MARITVEDCLENVENRFELVMIASKRARQLQIMGKDPMVPEDNDKPSVLALREIAEGLVDDTILIDTVEEEVQETQENAAEAEQAAKKNADISIEEAMDAELVEEPAEAPQEDDSEDEV